MADDSRTQDLRIIPQVSEDEPAVVKKTILAATRITHDEGGEGPGQPWFPWLLQWRRLSNTITFAS